MIRTLLNRKLARMVKERKRNISRVVLDVDTGTINKGRTPDRVKRYRKLSHEIEQFVNCLGRDPSFHSTGPFCKIKPHGTNQDMPESSTNDQSESLTCDQSSRDPSSTDCNDLKPRPISPLNGLIFALDCEMVECISTTGSSLNSLARCSIVDYCGEIILDLYVEQTRPVIDYRYRYSGINERILKEKPCISYKEVRDRVKKTIDGKLLLGHSIHNDFQVLDLSHPPFLTIDLASKSVRSMLMTLPNSTHKYALKHLAFNHLNRVIQKGTHSSVEDSRASMDVFKLVENLWLLQNDSIVSSLISYHGESYLNDEYWPDDIAVLVIVRNELSPIWKMHPNLSPHLHTEECNRKIQALLECRVKNRFCQYLGACNTEDDEMLACFRKEAEERRQRNFVLSRERRMNHQPVDIGKWHWKVEQDTK